jgi:hypothetical protein
MTILHITSAVTKVLILHGLNNRVLQNQIDIILSVLSDFQMFLSDSSEIYGVNGVLTDQ